MRLALGSCITVLQASGSAVLRAALGSQELKCQYNSEIRSLTPRSSFWVNDELWAGGGRLSSWSHAAQGQAQPAARQGGAAVKGCGKDGVGKGEKNEWVAMRRKRRRQREWWRKTGSSERDGNAGREPGRKPEKMERSRQGSLSAGIPGIRLRGKESCDVQAARGCAYFG